MSTVGVPPRSPVGPLVWLECEECEDEYETTALEMPPHRCGSCEAAAEDRYLEELDGDE